MARTVEPASRIFAIRLAAAIKCDLVEDEGLSSYPDEAAIELKPARQSRQRKISKLQILNTLPEFESHPHRQNRINTFLYSSGSIG
jgi:hypothetical protein